MSLTLCMSSCYYRRWYVIQHPSQAAFVRSTRSLRRYAGINHNELCSNQKNRLLTAISRASAVDEGKSAVEHIKKSGKVTKTAILRLKVDDIRLALESRGAPAVGRKPDLAEQLLALLKAEIAEGNFKQEPTPSAANFDDGASTSTAIGHEPLGDRNVTSTTEASIATKETATVSQVPALQHEATAQASPIAVDQSKGATATVTADQLEQRQPSHTHRASTGGKEDPTLETGLAITWLGTSSGSPTFWRNNSSIALRRPGETYLVDCGEGTFNQLQQVNIDPATIKRIFITHMHGDHCFGLLGVLRSISASRQGSAAAEEAVHIHGPPGVHEEVVTSIRASSAVLCMPLVVHQFTLGNADRAQQDEVSQLGGTSVLLTYQPPEQQYTGHVGSGYADSMSRSYTATPGLTWPMRVAAELLVCAAQLQHRVPCWGYVFREVSAGSHKEGGRKVVLLGDTCGSESIAAVAADCDVLSHEATFAEGMESKAEIAQHSTAAMAGAFARTLSAKHLVLTHFSARYTYGGRGGRRGDDDDDEDETELAAFDKANVESLLREAKRAYGSSNVTAAYDFFTLKVPLR